MNIHSTGVEHIAELPGGRFRRTHLGGQVKIAIFGLGYVGTVTAAGLASRGHEVRGVDVDPVKVDLSAPGAAPWSSPASTS